MRLTTVRQPSSHLGNQSKLKLHRLPFSSPVYTPPISNFLSIPHPPFRPFLQQPRAINRPIYCTGAKHSRSNPPSILPLRLHTFQFYPQPKMSSGLQRRRVTATAGIGNEGVSIPTPSRSDLSSQNSFSGRSSPAVSSQTTNHEGIDAIDTSSADHKIAFDPRDMEEGEERLKFPKLTLMEEVLLLGLKDKQVTPPQNTPPVVSSEITVLYISCYSN